MRENINYPRNLSGTRGKRHWSFGYNPGIPAWFFSTIVPIKKHRIHSPDKPEPKRTWLVREIPNPKSQTPRRGDPIRGCPSDRF
jgi:hypothetical protein